MFAIRDYKGVDQLYEIDILHIYIDRAVKCVVVVLY